MDFSLCDIATIRETTIAQNASAGLYTHIQQTFELQVLLVFPRNDIVCDILQDACSRLEMDTFLSQTLPEAIESFQNITNGGHNLIIVDGRLPQLLDPETVARYATIG